MGGFYRGSFARGKEPPDDGTAHMFIGAGSECKDVVRDTQADA